MICKWISFIPLDSLEYQNYLYLCGIIAIPTHKQPRNFATARGIPKVSFALNEMWLNSTGSISPCIYVYLEKLPSMVEKDVPIVSVHHCLTISRRRLVNRWHEIHKNATYEILMKLPYERYIRYSYEGFIWISYERYIWNSYECFIWNSYERYIWNSYESFMNPS